jgi:DNA-binding transcriptional ArsR family regulator
MYLSNAPDDLALVSSALKAVAEPTRLRILKSLEVGELCACKIVELVGLSQPTVSRHLAILKAAGLVTERKEGRWTHYRTSTDASGFRSRLLSLLDTWGGEDDVVTRDWRRAEELRRATARP